MPLPSDEKLIALSQDILKQFDAIFGLHPGFRPAHAKGVMLAGTFTPTPEAASLTCAPHITRDSTPVTVRFSNSTGIPVIPDNDPNANPRGLAVRFHLAEHEHTDIVSHSTDGFPVRTTEPMVLVDSPDGPGGVILGCGSIRHTCGEVAVAGCGLRTILPSASSTDRPSAVRMLSVCSKVA